MFIIYFFLIVGGISALVIRIMINAYYKSENFLIIKNAMIKLTNECNKLNEHIESLRDVEDNFKKNNYGNVKIVDTSRYNYKRRELRKFSNSSHVYNCSLSVCRSAREKPFDYICKYFNIPKNEESLEYFEELLNNFSAVEEGRKYLLQKKAKILATIKNKIPWYIDKFSSKRLEKELGFAEIDLSNLHIPKYIMQYISPAGNSSMETTVDMNASNLDEFISYLDAHIKYRNSIKGQRALMTSKLRQEIKKRDNYTCCNCGNNVYDEPNLLLEIDHIIPLSKGGVTHPDNLQTLCWKCNRTKGAKVESDKNLINNISDVGKCEILNASITPHLKESENIKNIANDKDSYLYSEDKMIHNNFLKDDEVTLMEFENSNISNNSLFKKIVGFLLAVGVLVILIFYSKEKYNLNNNIPNEPVGISEEQQSKKDEVSLRAIPQNLLDEVSKSYLNANVRYDFINKKVYISLTDENLINAILFKVNGGVLDLPKIDSTNEEILSLFGFNTIYKGTDGYVKAKSLAEHGFTDTMSSFVFSKVAPIYLGGLDSNDALYAYGKLFGLNLDNSKVLGNYLKTGKYPYTDDLKNFISKVEKTSKELSVISDSVINVTLLYPNSENTPMIEAVNGVIKYSILEELNFDFEPYVHNSESLNINNYSDDSEELYDENFLFGEEGADIGDILTITSDKANLRKEPSINAEIVGYWVKGDKVTVYEVAEGDGRTWYKTDPNKDWWISENTVNGSI